MKTNFRNPILNALKAILLMAVLIFTFGAGNSAPAEAKQQTPEILAGDGATDPVDPITARISSDAVSFTSDQDVLLHVTLTNPNEFPVGVLDWLTPVNGVEEPLFAVTRDGRPVEYLGKLGKRAVPTEEDYVVLQPGESLARDVALSSYYNFSASGSYQVSYFVSSVDLFSGLKDSAGSITSNSLELFIEGRQTSRPDEVIIAAVTGSNSFSPSCTASMQTNLINARNTASTYANDAATVLGNGWHGARYTTWFGTYDPGRFSTATNHFNAIRNAVDTANPMAFDCSCTDPGYYAYVYPSQPYNIYLCGAFWPAPLAGLDSKAGVLIHEVSHFYVVASTDDYVYGQLGSKNLAISNPSLAILNADNHEYFAENTPPLDNGAPVVTSIVVTNNADSGAGSLRNAIQNIGNGGTITFAPALAGQTITLASELLIENKSVTIDGSGLSTRVAISGNNSVRILNTYSDGTDFSVSLKSLILRNGRRTSTSFSEFGAALFADSNITFSIDQVSFLGNRAYQAGAIFISPYALVTISNSEFTSNISQIAAGAIRVNSIGNLHVDSSVFSSNSSGGSGGAVYFEGAVTSLVENSTFTNNTATGGGAISMSLSNADITIRNNLFSGNTSTSDVSSGGAINMSASSASYASLENNTFYGNQAAYRGGAISSSASTLMYNNTFSNNQAANGASLHLSAPGSTTFYNNIMANNTGGGECSSSGTTYTTGSNNLVEDGSAICRPTLTVDPQLYPLADNGGPTQTMALPLISPAIDAGNDANCTKTDQRGVSRPQEAHCDIGAYEYAALTIMGSTSVGGATLSYTDGVPMTATSAPDGSYSFSVPFGWTGTVTPSLAGFSFTPDQRDYTILPANQIDQDYSAYKTFADVPYDYSVILGGVTYYLFDYIEALYDAGYTAGCLTGPLRYCPDNTMNRAESAVFMLRGEFGSGYVPPVAPWGSFADDWSPGPWAEKWAEGMLDAAMTAGCLTDPLRFCPWDQFPRVQAAVFGLRMKHGMSYTPPDATGTLFADMSDTGYWGTKWAEQAYTDGLLPACGSSGGKPMFCPNDLVTRAWGAYLIVRAKNLPLLSP